jgi:hypothetical protein
MENGSGSRFHNRQILLLVTLALMFSFPRASTASTPIKDGDSCSPVGAMFKQGSTNFICKKSGTKIIWKKQTKMKASTVPEETFVMPRVVGMNLQFAQDLLQSKGSYFMVQTDYKGLNRFQILDRNWKVCAQSPAAGKKMTISTLVTLASVKLVENC